MLKNTTKPIVPDIQDDCGEWIMRKIQNCFVDEENIGVGFFILNIISRFSFLSFFFSVEGDDIITGML